jgi:dihydroorotate dehydrogenase
MPIQKRARYRTLASLLDTSFGRSSEKQYPNHFIKMTMPLENTINIKSQIIINFASPNVYNEMRVKYREEILDMIGKRLGRISEEYKRSLEERENAGNVSPQQYEEAAPKTVKLSVDNNSIREWTEPVSMSAYRTNKTCIFHLQCVASVS